MPHPALTDPAAAAAFLRLNRPWMPHFSHERVSITQTWDGKNKGKPLCRASVHNDFGVSFHQCTLAGVEQTADPDRLWWCRIHGPTGTAARGERAAAKERERQADQARRRRAALDRNPHVQALLKIARGDNDAMGTAREALGPLFDELAKEG